MGSVEDFRGRSRRFAQRFLKTAVVVDDRAYMPVGEDDGPRSEVRTPGRRPPTLNQESQHPGERRSEHTLDARSMMDSFSSLGVICGVLGPDQSELEAMRQADIVVLDWLLQDGRSGHTLNLLRELLTGERERNSLRLIAIYTGEAGLEKIYQDVFDELNSNSLDPKEDESKKIISYPHGRIVLYAKSAVNLASALQDRSVAEGELPHKLVEDFASMTEGLLPSIALTSLTAVREGEHKILDRFSAELDPAFVAHMACLPDPEDAERQIVVHVAEELRGLVDEAVAAESPAGKLAVEDWIRRDGRASFKFGERELDLQQTVKLVKEGLKASDLADGAFRHLSTGFACSAIDDLDERLAFLMSFRTVYNAPPPTLWLGSVVTMEEDGDQTHLICMRPRCDSVRLDKETTFTFLPLVPPSKNKEQIVTRIDQGFTRRSIALEPSGWILREFRPTEGNRAITATRSEHGDGFEFTDSNGMRYKWQGELKAEYAQRIAQTFATTLSRVAVDESEWLRRMTK